MGKHQHHNNNNIKGKIMRVLNNHTTHNIVSLISAINMIAFFVIGSPIGILIFAMVGLAMTIISKNPSIILLISIAVSNLIVFTRKVKEGLENSDTSDDDSDAGDMTDKDTVKSDIKTKVDDKKSSSSADDGTDDAPSPTDATTSAKTSIDQFTTTEDAYEGLSDLVGAGGLKSISKETKDIVESQKGMIENMKSMQPLIKQAQSLLQSMNAKKST